MSSWTVSKIVIIGNLIIVTVSYMNFQTVAFKKCNSRMQISPNFLQISKGNSLPTNLCNFSTAPSDLGGAILQDFVFNFFCVHCTTFEIKFTESSTGLLVSMMST